MKKFWMMLGCVTLLLSGCGDPKADETYESGKKALEKKEYDTAIEMFDQVVKMDQRLSEAYRGAGIAWLAKDSYPEAIAAFSRSLNYMEEPNAEFEKDVSFYLAQARMEYGEIDKAIEEYGNILKKGEDVQAFFLRGKAYMEEQEFEKAQKDFTRALKECKDYDFYMNIYRIYQETGKVDEGEQYLQMALELEPETGEDYYHRGRIYEYLQNYEKAKDSLLKALELEYPEAMLLLGRVYLEMEDPVSARAMYQDYLSGNEKGAEAYNGLATCDIYEGNYDGALENIQKGLALSTEENKKGLLYNEIVAYEYKLDFATAKTKMAEYLALYPEDEEGLRENEFLSTR